MIKDHPHVCLYRPEIPQNTGNIGRLCAGTQSRLHIITPVGFSMDDKNLRRAGLDYWPFLDLELHEDFEAFLSGFKRVAMFSKFGTKSYYDMPKDTELLVFGQETKGLPTEIRQKYENDLYQIPMFHSGVRSYNLANSVAIGLHYLIESRHRT